MRRELYKYLDFVLSAGFIILVFYIYFKVSRIAAIYMTGGMILILLLSYLTSFKKLKTKWRYKDFIEVLKRFDLVREEELDDYVDLTPQEMHRQMYLLSKVFEFKPMILFMNSYYLFIGEDVIDYIINIFTNEERDEIRRSRDLIQKVLKKYQFRDKDELEAVLARLRERDAI